MTDTQTEERTPSGLERPEPAPTPFWHRPYVERYLTPLVLPIAVVIGLVAYIINISRIFLSGHGHIPIFVGSIITALILIGATLLSTGADRLRSSAITLVSAAFILSIFSAGWLTLGSSQPEATGPTSLPVTLKVKQTPIAVTAAPGGALRFAPSALKATTGLAKFDVTVAGAGHTFNLEDPTTLFAGISLNAAGTVEHAVAFFPKPGDYTFFCAIPGHEAAGMKGTITVTGPPMTLAAALTASGNAATAAG
jgi:plastocyanin